jgi:hypothetical protein
MPRTLFASAAAAALALVVYPSAARADDTKAAAPAAAAPAAGAPAAPAAPAPAAAAPAAPAAPAPAADWKARYEVLYGTRDQSASLKEMFALTEAQLAKDPNDYEARWRLAQLYCWQANGMTDGTDLKANFGKKCWDEGEKAVALNAADVKGQYWATVGMGLYSEGLGILSALSQGIEGKFKNRVKLAIAADKDYLDGGPTMLFGRFYWKLPWPKRDVDESIKLLRATLDAHPKNLRAKIYLADSLHTDGKEAEAKALVQAALDAPLGWDQPDDRRNHEQAKKWLANH